MQPASSRAEAHARAARAVAAEQADSELIAGHLLAAPACGDDAVVEQLVAAAKTAMDRGAPRAAATYLRRALEEPPVGTARARVLRALGNAEARAGDGDAIVHLREARALSHDPRERLDISLEIAHASTAYWPAGIRDIGAELSAALRADEDRDVESAMLARSLLLYVSVPTLSPQWRVTTRSRPARCIAAPRGVRPAGACPDPCVHGRVGERAGAGGARACMACTGRRRRV